MPSAERMWRVTASLQNMGQHEDRVGLAEEQLTGCSSKASDSHAADTKMAALE